MHIQSPATRKIVTVILRLLIAAQSVKFWLAAARPVQVLPYLVLAQMVLLVRLVHNMDMLFYLAGNVAVVCAALTPLTVQKTIHWVK